MSTQIPLTVNSLVQARPLPSWMRHGLTAIVVSVACWGAAMAYWRWNKLNPAHGELALALAGLPLLVLASCLVGANLVTRRTGAAPHAAPAASNVPSSQDAMPLPAPQLRILGTAVRAPHGASAAELLATIRGNRACAGLDPVLVDDDGVPVMTARSSAADSEVLQNDIREWFEHNGFAALVLSDGQWRALLLASDVVGELVVQAVRDDAAPILQLSPMLPPDWTAVQCRATAMWLKHTAARCGWPVARIRLADDHRAATAATLSDRFTAALATGAMPTLTLIVAYASQIDAAAIARWTADGTLFTSSQPQGRIPGEGAAGLLVSGPRPAPSSAPAGWTLMESMEEAQRATSADDAGRADARVLDALAQRIRTRTGLDFGDVAMVMADTDHRHTFELMAHVGATLPLLDGVDDVARLGVACGSCGIVPFITAVALAHHRVLEIGAPVLCISNEDAYRRCAIVVRPLA